MSPEPARPTAAGKLLAVLATFDAEHRRQHLAGIAARAGLALSTAHRVVAELTAWGALERGADDAYVVGRRLWHLGLLAPVQSELRLVAAPFVHDLHAATKATVHLAVLDGREVLYVDRTAGRRSVPMVSDVGSRLPLHATGVGKVLLAHAAPALLDEVLAQLSASSASTAWTVTDADELRRQLERCRAEGYATTDQEMSPGASSVAVPVRGRGGAVVAALGLVVPPFSSGSQQLTTMVTALRVTASGIERSLGG